MGNEYTTIEGRTVATAATVSVKGTLPALASLRDSTNTSNKWIAGALALPTAAYMLQDQEAHASQMERTFIAIKPDGVQRGLLIYYFNPRISPYLPSNLSRFLDFGDYSQI
ncbi:hypothetical protein L2E82_03762 [Cichorium intybus]|uniref:Uncharacterized protein n=1 Tax=Cichorium intybus TaxID=13427 RepID=A0ACB9H5Q9_CICIN|nr:hypothetical protein L2E82_03762 [Cichorium intybus]